MGNLGKGIQLQANAITHVGRVRSHNEDHVHLWKRESTMLAIVADGMGGAAAGEVASQIAVDTITSNLEMEQRQHADQDMDAAAELLTEAVQQANESIMQQAIASPQNKGMGTTLTMTYIQDGHALFAHVGDSRAYRVNRFGDIEQITSDHSFVQALLDAGHITEEQAETHPMGNVLYRALGQTHDLDVDIYNVYLNGGDRLVLCSDGLTRHVRSYEIAESASRWDDPNAISSELVNLANDRGGEDNISVIVIVADSEPESTMKLEALDADDNDEDTLILSKDSQRPKPPPTDSSSNSPLAYQRSSQDRRTTQEPREQIIRQDSTEREASRLSADQPVSQTGRYTPWGDESKSL